MTDDYKKKLIDYLTGQLSIESQNPTDFDPYNETTTTDDYNGIDWEDVIVALRGKNSAIHGILEDENYDNYIMYGAYQEATNTNSKGFIIYMNENNKPFKIVLFNNVRGIQFLAFDKENSRVYGIVGDKSNYQGAEDNDAYFVYFNNLFLTYQDDYPPQQTYSYRIWNDGSKQFMARSVVKHPSNAYYLIYATVFTALLTPRVLELKINVGSSNELNSWSINDQYFGYAFYGWYNGDTPHFKLIINTDFAVPQLKLIQDNGSSVTETNLSCDTTLSKAQNFYIKDDYVAINENTIYFVYNSNVIANGTKTTQSGVYLYDGSTTIKTRYRTPATVTPEESGGYSNKNIPMLNIVKDGNTIYLLRYLSSEENNKTTIALVNLTKHPSPQESNFKQIGEGHCVFKVNIYNERAKLKRSYNLVSFVSFSGYTRDGLGSKDEDINGFCNIYSTIISSLGYTGYKYSNYNLFIPKYVNLYSNNKIVFSRNVYNTTLYLNTMTSSVEVPYNYLNNITIDKEQLLGETNYKLIEETNPISKNIYEVLHLNFFNEIDMIDEDTNKKNDNGATEINLAINYGTQTNYNNKKCLKYRINYEDNTNSVQSITWDSINDFNKTTFFTINVTKAIKNIEIISNDEYTTYLTINGDFEIGEIYSISQKVRIGEKPSQEQLQYNNEDLYYNNQPIMVYTQ